MVVRLLLCEVYPALYQYGQDLAISSERKWSKSDLERLALAKLDELDSELLHCLRSRVGRGTSKKRLSGRLSINTE
jgi:hypothetical protein